MSIPNLGWVGQLKLDMGQRHEVIIAECLPQPGVAVMANTRRSRSPEPFGFAQDKLREGVAVRHTVSLRGADPAVKDLEKMGQIILVLPELAWVEAESSALDMGTPPLVKGEEW